MRKLLLNPTPLFRKLRQLSLLLTLLLALPQTAWGQEVSTTYTFTKTEAITSTDYVFSVSSTSDATNYGWKIKSGYLGVAGTPLDNALGFSNIPQYDSGSANAFTFDVISDFTLSGAFLSAEITYTLSNDNSICKAEIYKDDNGTNKTLTSFDNLNASPQTLIWNNNSQAQENQFFDGHKIIFHFSLGAGSDNASISIQSIKITTSQLIVDNTAVTNANRDNITNTPTTFVTFTPATSTTPNTLVLDGADIDGPIISVMDDLTIHLAKSNSEDSRIGYLNGAGLNGIKSLNNGRLTFTAAAGASLKIKTTGDAASAITGFANVTMGTGAYLQTNIPTKYDTNGKNFREQVSSANIVNELTITSTPCYPLWVGNSQFTSTSTPAGFSFTASDNKLTISNADQQNPIISGLANLTIALDGNSKITRDDSTTIIRSINPEAALTFQAGTGDCSLYLKNSATFTPPSPLIKNFASISYSGLNYSSKSGNPINDATTHEAILSSATIYPLWIGNTPVTSTTTSGTGWSYDNNNKKLTLNGGTNTVPTTITGQIISGIGDLTIFLTGTTILKAADSETSLINSTNNGILSFDTNPTAIGSLAFKDDTGNAVFAGEPISGFTSKTYSNGLDYDATTKTIGVTTYDIVVDGQNITSASKTDVMNNGKVTYDSENRILTLNDGTTTSSLGINVTSSSDLTVELNGSISVTGSMYAFNTNGGKINFVKGTGATNVELTATCGNGGTPISFDNITLGSGLYWKPIDSETTVITTNPEFLIIEDYAMTDTKTITSTGTITYDSTNKVLTFVGFTKRDDTRSRPYIKSGITGLKIVLKGTNSLYYDTSNYIFEAIGTTATILFDGTEGGTLNLTTNTSNLPYSGFAGITYNKLVYYNSGGYGHDIKAPWEPIMGYNDQEKVTLGKDYSDGDIYYTITYADGKTANVAKTKYTAEFALDAPGTVEAWVEANGATTSTVKGKHFGYKDAPFVMAVNETKTPELIPAFEAGDNIGYATAAAPYSSSNTGVATFNGTITAVAFGNATLTTALAHSGQSANVVILNSNNKFETVVKVAKEFNYVNFASGQSYATCILPEKLTKPDGLKVYYITGTNGNTVTTQEIDYLPDGIPILLEKTAETIGSVTARTDSSSVVSGNILQYATSDVNTTGSQYILYKNEFVKASGTILPGNCYLQITTNLPARGVLGIGNDGSTAIEGIEFEATKDEEWYDLQGRRIQKPTKPGLYIVNGKKVVVTNK